MLVEIDLLDYLAYQMGCGVLSDLRCLSKVNGCTGSLPRSL